MEELNLKITLNKILREREIIILEGSEKKDYLNRLIQTLKEATKEWFDKKYKDVKKEMPQDWCEFSFKKAPLKTISNYISCLNLTLEFLKYDGGLLEDLHIDKNSGFPTWAEINKIYQMPDNSPFAFECNEKELGNELKKIRRIVIKKLSKKEPVDLDIEDYRMVKYYKAILDKRKTFPKMRILSLEKYDIFEKYEDSSFSSFDYSSVNNYPSTLDLNISTMPNLKIKSLKNYKGEKGARLFEKNTEEISLEFRSFLEKNMHFDTEYIEFRLKEMYPDLDIRVKKTIFGPFYFSKDQNFDDLRAIVPCFSLEKLFELEKDPFPILVLQEDSKGYQSWNFPDEPFKGVMFYSASHNVRAYLKSLEKRVGML